MITSIDPKKINRMACEKKQKKIKMLHTVFTKDLKNEEIIQSKILSILNKLNSERIDQSVLQMEITLKTVTELNLFLDILFSKSINEAKFASLYVKFYTELKQNHKIYEKFVKGENILMRTLLQKANELFHKIPVPKVITEDMTIEQQYELKNEAEIERLEYFGTIRLIAELYKQQAVVYKLPLICADELYEIKSDLTIEALTILLKESWRSLKNDANPDSVKSLKALMERMKLLESVETLSKRVHILVSLCLEEIKRDWDNSTVSIDRSVSTPVKVDRYDSPYPTSKTPSDGRKLEDKYAPQPSKPRATRGPVHIDFRRRDERDYRDDRYGRRDRDRHDRFDRNERDRERFGRYHDHQYPSQTPTQMKTPLPQQMDSVVGEFGEKSIEKFVKGTFSIDDIMAEIKKANAFGECVKKTIMNYETCSNEQLVKIKELMMRICKEDCKTSIEDTLSTLKEDTEGLEGGANDVIVALFTALFVNGKYEWENIAGYLDEQFCDMIMKKSGVNSQLYVLSHTILEVMREKKNVEELAKELMEKEECFEEICIGSLASNIFTALIKAASGSNIAIRSENKQKVIDMLNEIMPLLKIIGQDDKKGFEKQLDKLWIDPDDDTKVILEEIKNLLTQNGLL